MTEIATQLDVKCPKLQMKGKNMQNSLCQNKTNYVKLKMENLTFQARTNAVVKSVK